MRSGPSAEQSPTKPERSTIGRWTKLTFHVTNAGEVPAEELILRTDLPELLIPVSPAVEAKLMDRTNFDFRVQRYAAKRFRVVKINLPLLEQEGALFTITPFPDLAIAAKAQTTSRLPKQEGMREWVGETASSENVSLGAEGEPVEVPEQSFSIWVNDSPREVSLKVARKIAVEEGDTARLQMLPKPSSSEKVTTRLDVQTVQGQWFARPNVTLILQAIEDDPRYHFVYEVDPRKMLNSVHGGGRDGARITREAQEFRSELEKERAEEAKRNAE